MLAFSGILCISSVEIGEQVTCIHVADVKLKKCPFYSPDTISLTLSYCLAIATSKFGVDAIHTEDQFCCVQYLFSTCPKCTVKTWLNLVLYFPRY